MAPHRVVLLQPFLRSFLAGLLAATAVGLGLLVTLAVLATGGEALFEAVLSTGAVVAFVVGAPATGALVGLAVARHAGGRLGGLGAGLLAGAAGQFVVLVAVTLAVALAAPGTNNALVAEAEDGVSAEEFTVGLLTLLPAGLTAGLVGLAASGSARADAYAPAPAAPSLAADVADALPAPDAEADEPTLPKTLTCPRCHTPNAVPPNGRVTCRECGLVGRAA